MSRLRFITLVVIAAAGISCPSAGIGPLYAQETSFLIPPEKAAPVLFETRKLVPPKATGALTGSGRVWQMPVDHPGDTSAIRIHVVVKSATAPKPWRLKVLDGTKVVEEIESVSPFIAGGNFWTTEIAAKGGTVEIWTDGDPSGIRLEVDAYAFRVDRAIPQATHGHDDKQSIGTASKSIQDLGLPVARLTIMNDRGGIYCSGFLVTESLLMTNEHCVRNQQEAASLLADFGYDSASAPRAEYRGLRLEAVDHGLDYALVRMSQAPGVQWKRVVLQHAGPIPDGLQLAVVQHPTGLPKMAVIDDCIVEGNERVGRGGVKTDFGHTCDTEGGSSGSPVFLRSSGEVVGLHHLGFREGNTAPVNQAVHLSSILKDLKDRFTLVEAELSAANASAAVPPGH